MTSFFKKPTVKDQMKAQDCVLRQTQRDIGKDRRELERQEKQLELEIKKLAKQGNKESLTVIAKQLIVIRKQKARTYAANSKITSIGTQTKAMHSNVKMAEAMGTAAKTMGQMNKQIDPQKLAQTMQAFEKESTKMEMSEELINDSLDDILNESGDEEEYDAIVTQVLDEIGIDIMGKVSKAPSAHRGKIGEAAASVSEVPSDAELEKMLAQLRA